MKLRPLLAWIVVAAGLVACADLLGFKELRQADAGADAGPGPDAGVDADTCAHARWPDAPTADDPGGDSDAGGPWGYVLALRHVYFSTSPDGGVPSYGYDLDSRCTTNSTNTSCTPAQAPDPTTFTDGVGGVDGQTIYLMQQLQTFVASLTDQSINDEISSGKFTMLLRLFQYRGLANQTVNSGLLFGIQGSPGTVGNVAANFDGNDAWQVANDDSLGGATEVPVTRTTAYVKTNTLVATYPGSITLRVILPPGIVTGTLAVQLNEPTMTGSLVKRGDGRYDIANGILIGRWPIQAMLQAVAQLNVSNSALCASSQIYDSVRSTICSQRDIASLAAQDNTNAPCDAASVAIGFDAVAAQISGEKPFSPVTTPCADAGACN